MKVTDQWNSNHAQVYPDRLTGYNVRARLAEFKKFALCQIAWQMTTEFRQQSRARPIPPDSIWQSDSGELTIPPQRHRRNTMVAICHTTRALRFHATRWLRLVTHNVYDSSYNGMAAFRSTLRLDNTAEWWQHHCDQHFICHNV